MRYLVASVIFIIGLASTDTVFGVAQVRGQITSIDLENGIATVNFFGNPELNQGMALYVHDAYGKTKGRLTLMESTGGTITASIESGMEVLACGNFVASFEAKDSEDADFFGRYEYNVKVRYEKQPRFYDVLVDRVYELDRYLRFIWEDGRAYRVDTESINELALMVVNEELILVGMTLKDDVETEADRYVAVSQLPEDIMPWQAEIVDELRGLEVLVENEFLFTYKEIKAVKIGDRAAGVPTQLYIRNLIIPDADIRTAMEDSIGQLNTGTLQTEEVITVYPVIFRFDQYRRVIVALQETINQEIRQPNPDLEEIARLQETLSKFENSLTMQDIVSVRVVIKDADDPSRHLTDPIVLDNRGDSWQAKVNLTRGNYRYYFELEVRAEPCNLAFDIEDPLNPDGIFTVLQRIIPIQVNDMAARDNQPNIRVIEAQ